MSDSNLAEIECAVCGAKTAHQRTPTGAMACVPCMVRRDMAAIGGNAKPTHVHIDTGYRWTAGRIIGILLFMVLVALVVAGAVLKSRQG